MNACSTETADELSQPSQFSSDTIKRMELNNLSDSPTYVINYAPGTPICEGYITPTQDIQIQFSEPLAYDAILEINLKVHDGSVLRSVFSPWPFVMVDASERNVVIDTSCKLPDFIECGEFTATYSQNFRVEVKGGEYFGAGADFDYVPEYNNFFDFTVYRYCLGGGWNDL